MVLCIFVQIFSAFLVGTVRPKGEKFLRAERAISYFNASRWRERFCKFAFAVAYGVLLFLSCQKK